MDSSSDENFIVSVALFSTEPASQYIVSLVAHDPRSLRLGFNDSFTVQLLKPSIHLVWLNMSCRCAANSGCQADQSCRPSSLPTSSPPHPMAALEVTLTAVYDPAYKCNFGQSTHYLVRPPYGHSIVNMLIRAAYRQSSTPDQGGTFVLQPSSAVDTVRTVTWGDVTDSVQLCCRAREQPCFRHANLLMGQEGRNLQMFVFYTFPHTAFINGTHIIPERTNTPPPSATSLPAPLSTDGTECPQNSSFVNTSPTSRGTTPSALTSPTTTSRRTGPTPLYPFYPTNVSRRPAARSNNTAGPENSDSQKTVSKHRWWVSVVSVLSCLLALVVAVFCVWVFCKKRHMCPIRHCIWGIRKNAASNDLDIRMGTFQFHHTRSNFQADEHSGSSCSVHFHQNGYSKQNTACAHPPNWSSSQSNSSSYSQHHVCNMPSHGQNLSSFSSYPRHRTQACSETGVNGNISVPCSRGYNHQNNSTKTTITTLDFYHRRVVVLHCAENSSHVKHVGMLGEWLQQRLETETNVQVIAISHSDTLHNLRQCFRSNDRMTILIALSPGLLAILLNKSPHLADWQDFIRHEIGEDSTRSLSVWFPKDNPSEDEVIHFYTSFLPPECVFEIKDDQCEELDSLVEKLKKYDAKSEPFQQSTVSSDDTSFGLDFQLFNAKNLDWNEPSPTVYHGKL